jgi:asparagine synthase (glutamine-hydrolysing)
LTGEGADEFLAGYDIFKENKIRRFWARQPHSRWRPELLKRLYRDLGDMAHNNPDFLAAFFGTGLTDIHCPWYSHAVRWRNNSRTRRFLNHILLTPGDAEPLAGLALSLPSEFERWDPLARAQYLEITTFLSPYLLSSQGDRMGMAHSVEGRFPFLDYRLVEFCNQLPPRLKLRGLKEKELLKQAARRWLPESILARPKRPYRAPVQRSFFNDASADYVGELLSPASLKAVGLFKPQAVEQLLNKVRAGFASSQTDGMALTGIVSTQLVHHLFVKAFPAPTPLSQNDRVKVCRAKPALEPQFASSQ